MGALFGFLFGWLLQEIAELRKKKNRKKVLCSRRLNSLRTTYAYVFWNLEAIALVKKNLCVELAADRKNIQKVYGQTDMQTLVDALGNCQHFFKGFEEVQYNLDAQMERVEFVAMKDSYFSKTAFNIKIALKSLHDFIIQRNEMLSRYAEATRGGMTEAHANYYIPMLLSQAEGIIMKTDDSLFFMICMAKQLEKYAKDKFSSEPFPEGLFVLAELVDQVPDEDYIPGYVDAIGIEYNKPSVQSD